MSATAQTETVSPGKTEMTLVLRRIYDAPPEEVFAAWTDAAQMRQWYAADANHQIHKVEADVRVGGSYEAVFGLPGEEPYVETGRYLEVVPGRKLVFEMSLALKGEVFSRSVIVIDFVARGGRTELVLSDTGDDAPDHAQGWNPALAMLEAYLARK